MPQLPSDFVANVGSSSTSMLASLSPVVELIVGVLLAGVVITLIIHAIKK